MQSATDTISPTSTPHQTEAVFLGALVNGVNIKVDVLFEDPNVVIRIIDADRKQFNNLILPPDAAIQLHDVLCDAIADGLVEAEDEDQGRHTHTYGW